MSTIGELVQLDADAAFRSDVQLDAYDKPYNLGLLRSYLFTDAAPQGLASSRSILKTIVDAYNNGRLENRMVVIANYGHGKSHLALSLANYFGRPANSEEVKIVLGKIAQASKDSAGTALFDEFKRNHPRHMVLRLRGDMAGSLRSQFVRALEEAMQGEPTLKNQTLPFWFTEAEKQLRRLKDEQLQKANAYLEQFRQTVDDLIDAVKARRMDVYERCVGVIYAVHEIKPNFGSEVSLKEIVNWAAKELCGPGKTFSGILILFDEFSLYLQNYVSQSSANELQDLMNGVDDQRQKVVVVAFSQHDPVNYVQSLMQPSMVRESVIRELSRLPQKIFLYSLMESVIDAYLKQSPQLWNELKAADGFFSQACDVTFDAYQMRYKKIVGWEYENFREIVAKGCFPLHPMTTALLCNIKLDAAQGGQDPRTVLEFVMDHRQRLSSESVIKDEHPNWVLPIELVDFFGPQLSGERYRMYDAARRTVGNEPGKEDYHRILKALLLHEVAELRGNAADQIAQLATMAGLEEGKTKAALRILAEDRTIRQDPTSRRYSFWAGGLDVSDYERVLQSHLKETALTAEDIQKLTNFQTLNVPPVIPWGHADDWAADSHLVLARDFNASLIRSKLQEYHISLNGVIDGNRGVAFWLLAETQEEHQTLSKTVQAMLKESLGENDTIPVLIVLPRDATPDLLEALKRLKALERFTIDQKQTYKQMYDQDVASVRANIARILNNISYNLTSITQLRPVGAYLTNPMYRDALAGQSQLSVPTALALCYNKAYPQEVPEFYTHYKLGASNLRGAAKTVAVTLLGNQIGSNETALSANPVAGGIVDKYLTTRWGILNPSTKRIQVPTHPRIKTVWNYLDQAFAPSKGETSVGNVLVPLLNPPFGYDYNTLTLIFCAWFGYNAQDLQVSINGRRCPVSELSKILAEERVGPRDFINKICSSSKVALSRQDLSSVELEVRDAFARVDKGELSISEAQQFKPVLEKYAGDDRFDEARRKQAGSTAELLTREIELAQKHDQDTARIHKSLTSTSEPQGLLRLEQEIRDLPSCTVVVPAGIKRTELMSRLDDRLQDWVNQLCQQAEKLNDLKEYSLLNSHLEDAYKYLRERGRKKLADQVGAALRALEVSVGMLERHADEDRLRKRIADMDPKARLKLLYGYRQDLKAITGATPQTITVRDDKLNKIETRIAEIESAVRQVINDVARVTDRNSLTQWHHRFGPLQIQADDTPLAAELDKLEPVQQSLEDLLRDMEQITHISADTPAALEALEQQLDKLADRHKEVLGDLLQPLIERGFRYLERRRTENQERSRLVFQQLEADFGTRRETPTRLMSRLEVPPPFLPVDLYTAWDDLKKRVQAQIEEDMVSHVVESFKRIQNPELRKECLLRLKSAYEQKEN